MKSAPERPGYSATAQMRPLGTNRLITLQFVGSVIICSMQITLISLKEQCYEEQWWARESMNKKESKAVSYTSMASPFSI